MESEAFTAILKMAGLKAFTAIIHGCSLRVRNYFLRAFESYAMHSKPALKKLRFKVLNGILET
jgi:hypothetical protein